MDGGVEPTDFGRLRSAFDGTGVAYREASPEEVADLARRFGVGAWVGRGDPGGSPRALFLAGNRGRSPGPVMLFDRDGGYVGVGDDRTDPPFTTEFYGRTG